MKGITDGDRELAKKFVKGHTLGKSENLYIVKNEIRFSWHVPIARRFNKCGVNYLFNSRKGSGDASRLKKIVLKALKGTVLHMLDCSMCINIDCGLCHGKQAVNTLKSNNHIIKLVKENYRMVEDKTIKRKCKKKILWLENQNKLLKPIVVANEL